MGTRHLTEEPLRVVDSLRGRELASPLRRALALAIDCAVLVVPSVAVALGAALVSLRLSDPTGYRALRGMWRGGQAASAMQHDLLRDLAPLLVRVDAEGLPAAVSAAVEKGDLDRAATLLAGTDLAFSLSLSPGERPPVAAGAVRVELGHFIPKSLRAAALLGVAAVYFTILTRGRRGATVGKRVAGITVVRLDGHRLSLMESFERFAGYLHIPGSLGIGLLDLWHDPNRRMAHDRAGHTAVLRTLRRDAA